MNTASEFDFELLDRLLGLGHDGLQGEKPSSATTHPDHSSKSYWLEEPPETWSEINHHYNASATEYQGSNHFETEWNDLVQLISSSTESSSRTSPLAPVAASKNRIRLEADSNIRSDLEHLIAELQNQVSQRFKRKLTKSPTHVSVGASSISALNRTVELANGSLASVQDPRLSEFHNSLTEYRRVLRISPRWSEKEHANLVRGVKAQNERLLLTMLAGSGKAPSLDEARAMIALMPEQELLMNINDLDWNAISQHFVQTKDPQECRIQWTVNNHPVINHSPLFDDSNRDEIETLAKLVPKYLRKKPSAGPFFSPWQLIASELGTNRTPIQCFMMYQKRINKQFTKGRWTGDEDSRLIEAVKLVGTQNWQAVSMFLDGRTGQQCLHRFEKALNPQIKRGRWTKEEDELLKRAVTEASPSQGSPSSALRVNWSKVRNHVPGRTDVQCRERWVNVLDPALSSDPFSSHEDAKLIKLVELHGLGHWSRISQEMGGRRTDNQCWRRWKKLRRHR